MENQNCLDQCTSLLCLPEDCFDIIFEILQVIDCLSLAETCTYLEAIADRFFAKNFKNFKFGYELIRCSNEDIERIFRHIGPYFESIAIRSLRHAKYILPKIDNDFKNCKNLKKLTFSWMKGDIFQDISKSNGFLNLEELSLYACDLADVEDYFKSFCNLKSLSIFRSRSINIKALEECFRSNTNITNFTFDHSLIVDQVPLLPLIPLLVNLERLSIGSDLSDETLTPLLKLKQLKVLQLQRILEAYTFWMDLNEFLFEFSMNETLKEFRIGDYVNGATFAALKNFKMLETLVLEVREMTIWDLNFTLPPNLRHLLFDNFEISIDDIFSLLKRSAIETLHISNCRILDNEGTKINKMDKLRQKLQCNPMNIRKQIVNVHFNY